MTLNTPTRVGADQSVESTRNSLIGASPPRLDAWEKVTGATVYAGDLSMPGMLHGKILWSKFPHAIIRRIDTAAARDIPGVHAVLTAADVAGINRFGLAILDQRVLADAKVRSIADPVALIAAESEEVAEAGRRPDRRRVRAAAGSPDDRGCDRSGGDFGSRRRQRPPAHHGPQGGRQSGVLRG